MALIITDECINCDVCEPECPNEAISQGTGDLRDRPGEMHRVRRPFRRAAMRRGLPGRLHSGQSRISSSRAAIAAEIRGADGGKARRDAGLSRGSVQPKRRRVAGRSTRLSRWRRAAALRLRRRSRRSPPTCCCSPRICASSASRCLLELGDALLQLVARAVDAPDAIEAAPQLQVMFADLRLERRHHRLAASLRRRGSRCCRRA